MVDALGPDRTSILSFDSYYHDFAFLPPEERALVNFDHPDSLDVDLLVDHLDALRAGYDVAVPVYDFATHTRSPEIELVAATDYVVIEGILLFSSPAIRRRLDHLIYRDCPAEVRFERRLLRDVASRGRTPESVLEQWTTTVQPMHELYVEPYIQHADLITRHGYDLDRAVARIVETVKRAEPLAGCLDDWRVPDRTEARQG